MKKQMKVALAALALGALTVGNWAASHWSSAITAVLCGTGENFSNAQLVLEQGDELCQMIGEESIVMLKNENDALPLADSTKENVFGWGATDEGFLLKGVEAVRLPFLKINR